MIIKIIHTNGDMIFPFLYVYLILSISDIGGNKKELNSEY
ncbi:Hypothetical cytosolic protein [Lactobacillus helveticus H10]|nr:Hypothetical cytosolic protein [Lactobacillus helveticus H10]